MGASIPRCNQIRYHIKQPNLKMLSSSKSPRRRQNFVIESTRPFKALKWDPSTYLGKKERSSSSSRSKEDNNNVNNNKCSLPTYFCFAQSFIDSFSYLFAFRHLNPKVWIHSLSPSLEPPCVCRYHRQCFHLQFHLVFKLSLKIAIRLSQSFEHTQQQHHYHHHHSTSIILIQNEFCVGDWDWSYKELFSVILCYAQF